MTGGMRLRRTHGAGAARRVAIALAGAFAALAMAVPAVGAASTITPTRFDDPPGAGACPSDCSLRQAIVAAGSGGTVVLGAGTYKLTLGAIALSADVTIVGQGAATSAISAGNTSQLFTIASGKHVTIGGALLTEGKATGSSSSGGRGGAIRNEGALTLSAVRLEHNVAAGGTPTSKTFGGGGGEGGAIVNTALLTINGSAFVENTAQGGSNKFGAETTEFSGGQGDGGAIHNQGALFVTSTSFETNHALQGSDGTLFKGSGGEGGAIENFGSVRLSGALLSGNVAASGTERGGEGGAIGNFGAMRIADTTLSANVAAGPASDGGEGGAIQTFGSLTIQRSTLSGNTASGTKGQGGAINSFSALQLEASTLAGNSAGKEGGAIENFTSLEATNATITGNSAGTEGGGLQNFGTATLANVTLTANSAAATKGGNVQNFSTLLMHDTIIAQGTVSGGSGGENCAGTGNFVSQGFNLEDRNQCSLTATGDQVNVANPQLGPLAANGGPTATIALLAGSPAIDAGDTAGCTSAGGEALGSDQRGVSRPQGARCDIGAFELTQTPATPAPPPIVPSARPLPVLSGLRVTPAAFKAASSGPTIAAAKGARGARISYSDNVAATTSLVILRSVAGVRRGGRCVAPPRHPKRKLKRCTRLVKVATLSHLDRAGANRLRFSGRVRGRKLAPGSYTLTATPRFAGRTGRAVSTRFSIKR